MKLILNNTTVQLSQIPPGLAAHIYERSQITVKSFYKLRGGPLKGKTKVKIRTISLAKGVSVYPLGLLPKIKKILESRNLSFEIEDYREEQRTIHVPEAAIKYLRENMMWASTPVPKGCRRFPF